MPLEVHLRARASFGSQLQLLRAIYGIEDNALSRQFYYPALK